MIIMNVGNRLLFVEHIVNANSIYCNDTDPLPIEILSFKRERVPPNINRGPSPDRHVFQLQLIMLQTQMNFLIGWSFSSVCR